MHNILGYYTPPTSKGMKKKLSCMNIVISINICIFTVICLVLQYINHYIIKLFKQIWQ